MLLTHYWKLLRSDSNHDIVKSSHSEAIVHQCLWFLYWRVVAWKNKLHLLILSIILPLFIIAQEKKKILSFQRYDIELATQQFLKTINTDCSPTSTWVMWSDSLYSFLEFTSHRNPFCSEAHRLPGHGYRWLLAPWEDQTHFETLISDLQGLLRGICDVGSGKSSLPSALGCVTFTQQTLLQQERWWGFSFWYQVIWRFFPQIHAKKS